MTLVYRDWRGRRVRRPCQSVEQLWRKAWTVYRFHRVAAAVVHLNDEFWFGLQNL